jgi:hypothetical protein
MDPKIEWTEAEGWPLYSGTLVGPQAIVDGVFMRLGEIGDNFSVIPTQLVAEGDTVVALGTYSWNRKGSGEPAEVKMGPRVDSRQREGHSVPTTCRHRQGALSHRLNPRSAIAHFESCCPGQSGIPNRLQGEHRMTLGQTTPESTESAFCTSRRCSRS